jgi:hypothetical protein
MRIGGTQRVQNHKEPEMWARGKFEFNNPFPPWVLEGACGMVHPVVLLGAARHRLGSHGAALCQQRAGEDEMTAAQMQQQLIAQLATVLKDFRLLKGRSQHNDLSDLPENQLTGFISRARAAIHRIAGQSSTYAKHCEEIMRGDTYSGDVALKLAGVISSLLDDIEAGYLQSYTELLHGELFADFLEMSGHLLGQGYKDAAAVIAGSSIEAHLRQLCQKAGIDTETGAGSPKKADRLNADLAGASVYSRGDQKNVTAWLDLRNKAAHGQYDQYQAGQVALLISGVRDFITRHPA